MRTILTIHTPEGVAFSYPLAGPLTRAVAWSLDLAIYMATVYVVSMSCSMLGVFSQDLAGGLVAVGHFIVAVGYSIAFEWLWRGRTPGKRVMDLRVIDAEGLQLQFHQVVIRNLLRPVDTLPAFYGVGGLAALISSKAQRLGDLAAGTVVVHTPHQKEPNLEQLLAGKYNSLRAYPHLAARLRHTVRPEEARIALQALLRREDLSPEAGTGLFHELADRFRSLVTFPPEAVEAVPDEQYVRNVVDILFRTKAESPTPRQ